MAFALLTSTVSFHGAVPAHRALSRSLNVPAALLLKRYGLARFVREIKDMGLAHINKESAHYGLSFIWAALRLRH